MLTRPISNPAYYGALVTLAILGAVLGSIVVLSMTTWWKSTKQLPDTGTENEKNINERLGLYSSCSKLCATRIERAFMFTNLGQTPTVCVTFDPDLGILQITDNVRFFDFGVVVDLQSFTFDSKHLDLQGIVDISSSPPMITFTKPSGLAVEFLDMTDPNSAVWSTGVSVIKHEDCGQNEVKHVFADTSPNLMKKTSSCFSEFEFLGMIGANSLNHGSQANICSFLANLKEKRAMILFQEARGLGPGRGKNLHGHLDAVFGSLRDDLTFSWAFCDNLFSKPIQGFVDLSMGLVHIEFDGRRISLGVLMSNELTPVNMFLNRE